MKKQMQVHSSFGQLFKDFPDCPKYIPMELLNEEWAKRNHGQTLDRLNERGGLCPSEMLAIIEKRRWEKMDTREAIDKIKKLLEPAPLTETDEKGELRMFHECCDKPSNDGVNNHCLNCGHDFEPSYTTTPSKQDSSEAERIENEVKEIFELWGYGSNSDKEVCKRLIKEYFLKELEGRDKEVERLRKDCKQLRYNLGVEYDRGFKDGEKEKREVFNAGWKAADDHPYFNEERAEQAWQKYLTSSK
jgi:hypothetical protein